MAAFLSFRGSRAGLFYNLSAGESCPLRIPFARPFDFTQGHELEVEWLRAAVSPTDKSQKRQRSPASHSRKVAMIPFKEPEKAKAIRDFEFESRMVWSDRS